MTLRVLLHLLFPSPAGNLYGARVSRPSGPSAPTAPFPKHMPPPPAPRSWTILALLVALLLSGQTALSSDPLPDQAGPEGLSRYTSRCYVIFSDLSQDEIQPWAEHMDAVFQEYDRRFAGFRPTRPQPLPLYIFRTQQAYQAFLLSHGINAANSSGMFFIQPSLQGLATWVGARRPGAAKETLQHEGFHQFAYAYLGSRLPVWLNEGLAQYFEHGVLTSAGMYLGRADVDRILNLKKAAADQRLLPLTRLAEMNNEDWSTMLRSDANTSDVIYDQAWSLVHFFIHAENARYRPAFERYLELAAAARNPAEQKDAFLKAFGTSNLQAFERNWQYYILHLEADPLSVAASRMELLAHGIRYLHEKRQRMPTSLRELRRTLERLGFEASRRRQNIVTRFRASDPSYYEYPLPTGQSVPFDFLPPTQPGELPTLSASRLTPTPFILWFRDEQGKLLPDVAYR